MLQELAYLVVAEREDWRKQESQDGLKVVADWALTPSGSTASWYSMVKVMS